MSREFAEEKKRREEAERQRAKNASSVSSNMQKPGASYTGSYQQRRVTNDKSASNLRNAQQNRTNTVSSNRNSAQTNTQQIQPTNYRDKTSQRQHKVNNDKSMANFEKTRQESIAKRTSPDPWEPKPTDAYGRLQKVGRNAGEVAKESLKRVYYGDVIATNEDGAISYSDDRRGVFDQKKYEESRKENKARQQEYIQKRDESEQRTADITRGANGLEKAIYDAVDSGTGMVADSAFGPLSLLHMGVRTAGSYRGKAMQEGATDEEDLWNSVMHGALEATTERFFRGIGVASKVTGGRGLSPASALANRLTRRMGGRAANAAQLAIRYGVGIGEENAEEILSALAENPMEEAIYKGAVRGRKADDIHSQLVDQSNQFRSQITSPEQAEMASAYLSSPDFIEENIKMYKEAGIPADQATQMAEAMRDYLAANLSGDVDKMADIESRLVNDIAGKRNLLPDLGEMRDTIAATTLLTGVTGLPGMVKTTDIGSRIKAELGDAKLRALANSAINFEDEEASMSAQAIKDRLDAGQEITASQAYELSEALEQQMAKNNEKEAAYFDTARRIISENNDNIPFSIDENGNTVMDEMTAKAYNVEKAKAIEIAERLNNAQVEGAEKLTDEELQRVAAAAAGFNTGVFTSNEINVLGKTNTLARSVFQEATGIDLDDYTVYKKNGQVDYAATSEKQNRALFALAADNLVESARVETANWIDTASGAALESVTKRMDGNGSAAVISALDNVDIRDKNAYMYNLTAADTMYSMARRMPLTWEQARDFSVAAFRGADESMLQEMYEAGRMDREAAEDDARGIQTVIDQAISKGKESGTAYVNGKFTDERTDKSKPIKKSDMKIFQDIAQQLNINIAISDSIQGNGQYSPKTGKITLNAASTTEQNLGYIFMHETTHHLRLYAPEHWNKLVQLVKNRWSDVDPDRMNAEIDAKIDLYKKATDGKQILSRDQALEEIIADSAHEFLLDENFAKEVCAEDMGLAKSILNSIRSTLEKLRTVIANNYSDDTRMRSLFSELDILEEAERLWLNAYSEAYKNNMAVGLVEWNERNGEKLSASVRNSFSEDVNSFQEKYREVRLWDAESAQDYFEKEKDLYEGFQTGEANRYNFMWNTMATFKQMPKRPKGEPDYISRDRNGKVSSEYWYTDDGVIRGSNHWGTGIASCDWALEMRDGTTVYGSSPEKPSSTRKLYAEANWSDFIHKTLIQNVNGETIATNFDNASGKDRLVIEGEVYNRHPVDGWKKILDRDSAYMLAVEEGDLHTAQKLVDKAAEEAGYTVKAYHGTSNYGFTEFADVDANNNIIKTANGKAFGDGFYFTSNKKVTTRYAGTKYTYNKETGEFEKQGEAGVYDVFLNLGDTFVIDWQEVIKKYSSKSEFDKFLRDNLKGKDSLTINNIRDGVDIESTVYVIYPNRKVIREQYEDLGAYSRKYKNTTDMVKSADPVTYDDDGNVIPLSERFNTEESDIRWSISEEDHHEYVEDQIIGKSENTPVELADEDVIRYSFGHGGTFFSRGIHAYSIKPTEAAVKTPNRKTVNPLLESGKDILERTMRKNMKTELLKQGIRGAKATDIINEKIDVVMKFFDAMNQFMIASGYQYTFIGLQNVEDAKINVRKLADGTVTITMSAMVKNSDYPVNFDFTTICKKRQAFNSVIEGLAKNAKNGEDISLSPSQLMEINNELRKAGVETACLGCFVESRRYNMQNYTNKVVNLWNSCVDDIARQKGIDPDTLDDFNFAKGKEATEEDFQNAADTFFAYENTKGEKGNPEARFRHIISSSGTKYMKHLHAADLVTTNGIKGIRDMSTRTKDFLGMLKSAYGQGAPKETIEYVPYNSEIALLPNKKGNKVSMEDYLKKVGGVRMQSFSDFLIANTFDYMQMVADMAARGFPAHAYTKEIAFARIFGMTGIKINMSVMFDVEPQEFWGKVFHEADYQKQKTLAEKYAGMTFYKNLEDIPEEFVDYNAEGERIVKPGGSVTAVTENGVSGYVTYLVGDENRSNREWEKVYRNALAEGLDEEAARQRANEMRRWIQSINFSDAKALQKQAGYGKNCGIIGVGVSDINILVMLDDDNVPYIIPYHASGLPEVIKSLTNLNHAADYTNDQNTRIFVNLTNADGEELGYDYVRKLKKDLGSYHAAWNYIAEGIRAGSIKYNGRVAEKNEKNKDGENYDLGALGGFDYYGELEKGKNPREAAEAYLAYCDEYGLLPVFPRFVGHQNYYKLLLDFSVTDLSNNGATSPQGPVRNIYPGANLEEGAETYDDLQNIISDEMQKQNEINQYRDSVVERVTEEFSSRMSEADEDTEEDTSDIRSSFSDDDIISQIAEEATDTEDIPREDAKDEEDRRRKAKSKEDFFAHMNAEWNERWLTEGKVLKKESVIRDIRQLIMGVMQNSDTSHQYKTKLVNSTMKDARNAYRLMKEGKWSEAGDTLYASALNMLEDAEFVDDSLFKQFKEVRDYLRHTEIFVGDEVKAEFEWDRFYKENRARMLLKNGDTNIDKVFMELAEMVPGEFNQDEVSNPADQLSVIANFLDRIQPYRQAYDSQTASELAFDIAEDLFNIVYQQGESYQSVADTYKARYDELTKKMKAEHQNAIRKIREQERDKRNKLRKEFTEKRKAEKAADKAKAEHKLMYKSIQKNVKKLSDLLTKETDEKHVPEPLRGPLSEMLTYFDLQKEGSKIWESKHGVSKAAQKLRDLREAWQKIADESDIGPFEYDEEMLERIQKLIKALDGKGSIDSLENKEMDIIDDMLAAVLHQLNVYEAVIKENQRIEVEKIANPFIESMYERIRKYGKRSERTGMIGALFSLVNEGEETPPYFFDRLGGGMQDMYNELRRGNDKHIRNMNYLRQRFQEICGGHENRLGRRKLPGSELEKWRSAGSLQKFDLAYGTIELTPAQIMSVYCLSQRQQAMNHMLKNGIVVAPVTFTASISEDIQSNIKGRKTDTKPIPLTEADINQIKTALTEDQKKMADDFMKLLNEDMSAWGNETSMELLGYQKFREKTYFPIKSASESLEKTAESHDVVEKIRSFSFTKGLTKNANNAIMVEDIFSVVADHCNKMSLYNAFAVPIRNFMKVFNYKRYDDEGRSTPLKQVLADAFGRSANDYILKFIDDLNGNTKTKSDPLEAVLNKTLANYKRASIGANVRVALQQPTAIMRAFMVLNPKYFAGIKVVSPAMTREMQEHCPIALWKSWGHYDVDMGRDIEEVMMNNDWSIGDTLSMGVYGALDNWTWTMIWQACKNEVKEKNPNVQEGTDEFWELCNKRASEVFDKTQVVDSIFHRSETMRSKNIMTKMMVSFMAEPTLTYNVLRDAAVNARERLKDGDTAAASALAARAVIVFLLNTAAVSASAALWDVVRGKDPDNWLADLIGGDDDDDEEEKTWGELFIRNFFNNVSDNGNLLNNIYFVKDIWGLRDGFGTSNMALEGWELLWKGIREYGAKMGILEWTDLREKEKTWYEMNQNFFGGLGYITGKPVKTLMKDLKPLWDMIAASAFASTTPGYQLTLKDGTEIVTTDYNEYIDKLEQYRESGELDKQSQQDVVAFDPGRLLNNMISDSGTESVRDREEGDVTGSRESYQSIVNAKKEEQEAAKEEKKKAKEEAKADSSETGETKSNKKPAFAKMAQSEKIADLKEKYSGLSKEERTKKVWDKINDGYREMVEAGDYKNISHMRAIMLQTGCDVEMFDQKIFEASKRALKKSIKVDATEKEIAVMEDIRGYLEAHGITQEELSNIAYKSETAKDVKAAMRLNDHDAIVKELVPLVRAGLSREDYERLWKYRNSGKASYTGKYAEREKEISTGTFNWPAQGVITSGFGYRRAPVRGASTYHQGIDIGGSIGDPIAASDGGTVTFAGWNGGYGYQVVVKHYDGSESLYSHLDSYSVQPGQVVSQGDQIARMGSTGTSSGPHLDFRIRVNGKFVNPMNYLGGVVA